MEVLELKARIALLLLLSKLTRIDMAIRIGKARVTLAHTGVSQVTIHATAI